MSTLPQPTCAQCGAPLPAGNAYCGRCGVPVGQMAPKPARPDFVARNVNTGFATAWVLWCFVALVDFVVPTPAFSGAVCPTFTMLVIAHVGTHFALKLRGYFQGKD